MCVKIRLFVTVALFFGHAVGVALLDHLLQVKPILERMVAVTIETCLRECSDEEESKLERYVKVATRKICSIYCYCYAQPSGWYKLFMMHK